MISICRKYHLDKTLVEDFDDDFWGFHIDIKTLSTLHRWIFTITLTHALIQTCTSQGSKIVTPTVHSFLSRIILPLENTKYFNLIAAITAGVGVPINMLWLAVFIQAMYYDIDGNKISKFKPMHIDKLLFCQISVQLLSCLLQSLFNFWMFSINSDQSSSQTFNESTIKIFNTLFAANVWFSYVAIISILAVLAWTRKKFAFRELSDNKMSLKKPIIICFGSALILASLVGTLADIDLQPSHIWYVCTCLCQQSYSDRHSMYKSHTVHWIN